MGYENYKWNIELEKGLELAFTTIKDILKKKNDIIDFNNLIFLLNHRTENMIKKIIKKLQCQNFLNVVL